MPKGTLVQKNLKRQTVAKGAIAGKPLRAIAQEAGCSERHVSRLAAEAETQTIIRDAFKPHQEQLQRMAAKAVRAVERAFTAQKRTKADHFTQLRAVERYGDLLELAAGDTKKAGAGKTSGPGRQLVTWEEFLVIGRARREAV